MIDTQAANEYIAARERYKQACSEYTKIRLITCHPYSSDEDLARHERARRVFRTQCKEFSEARGRFIGAMRAEKQGALNISNAELIEQYSDISISKVLEESKKEYTLKNVDQVYLDEIKKTAAMSPEEREEFVASGQTLDKFLEVKWDKNHNPDDPALGDFAPLSPETDKEKE